jgi:hypothetical protein
MTTTSGYSGRLGGRSSHCAPDQIQNARLLGYREAQKRIAREPAAVAADGPNESDDERQRVYDVHLEVLMG